MAEVPRGVWLHWKGHLYWVFRTLELLPGPPDYDHLELFEAACSTNGADQGRTLAVAVAGGWGELRAVAYPAEGDWSPAGRLGVLYIGLTLDGSPEPGLRPKVRDLADFAGAVKVPGRGEVPRFAFLGPAWHPGTGSGR